MTHLLEGIAPLPHLGVIRAQGEDAAGFLHGQLTQDITLIQPDQARLAAFCNAKGRMLASFVVVQIAPGDFALVVSREILAPTLKRLSMFVLRSKVKLSDASDAVALAGLAGSAALALFGGQAAPPWSHAGAGAAHAVALYPADGQARVLWLGLDGAPAPQAAPLHAATWQWGEVRSAVATITAPVVEAFVPQMLNYESVGGVNFKKGCYPGQEIVARSQFRGTLKRRAWPAHADAPLAAGMEVFHEADPSQPCGLVAQAAAAPGGGWDAIVSMQVAAAQGGRLAVGSAQGARLTLGQLPYLLMTEV